MKDETRFLAYHILNQIETKKAYSNIILNREFRRVQLSARNRGLVTELVYGSLRLKGHLDYIIDQFSNRPVAELDVKIRTLLRLGVYQLKFLDKVPARAAIHSTVELSKREHHLGIGKFINGVLRNINRGLEKINFPDQKTQPLRFISTYYSHPEWLIKRWLNRFGVKETIQLAAQNNKIPDLLIRANTLKVNPFRLADKLTEEYGFDLSLLSYPDEGLRLKNATGFTELPEFQEGLFTVQGQASMLVAHALQPKPGMKVIDLCAAPGGKTTHLAALMENQGDILAVDLYQHKLELIEANCRRLGVDIVRTLSTDATTLDLKSEEFDRVLLDAPCSGLGLLAQKPEIRWFKSLEEITELVKLQRRLFERGLACLKVGGIMVYSTCTISAEENHQLVKEFLKSDNVELIDLRFLLPATERQTFIEHGLDTPYLEFLPHVSHTEGFFIAALRKTSSLKK